MSRNETRSQLVTTEEVLRLSQYTTLDRIELAEDMYRRSVEEYTGRGDKDSLWTFLVALANVYEAGRLQGIREERQKRRA